jgi:hypothetical protein
LKITAGKATGAGSLFEQENKETTKLKTKRERIDLNIFILIIDF